MAHAFNKTIEAATNFNGTPSHRYRHFRSRFALVIRRFRKEGIRLTLAEVNLAHDRAARQIAGVL